MQGSHFGSSRVFVCSLSVERKEAVGISVFVGLGLHRMGVLVLITNRMLTSSGVGSTSSARRKAEKHRAA